MSTRRPLRARLKARMLELLSFYPPYVGAGIRVQHLARGHFRVRMKLRWYNRNYYGSHFGGSLYSMCDPFFVLALVEKLGPAYIVWDKAASVRFLKPGRGTVAAEFIADDQRVEEIRRQVEAAGKAEPEFSVDVVDREGEPVARVEKLLHVRRKRPREGSEP